MLLSHECHETGISSFEVWARLGTHGCGLEGIMAEGHFSSTSQAGSCCYVTLMESPDGAPRREADGPRASCRPPSPSFFSITAI